MAETEGLLRLAASGDGGILLRRPARRAGRLRGAVVARSPRRFEIAEALGGRLREPERPRGRPAGGMGS